MGSTWRDDLPGPSPAVLTGIYLGFGVLWIVASDLLVTRAFGLTDLTVQAQLIKGTLFVVASGAVIYGLITRRDRAIVASEERVGVILANITDTVLLTDEAGRFTYVCPNVHYIFGRDAAAVEAMGSIDELLGDGFSHEAFHRDRIVENVEREVTDADGTVHAVLITARPVDIEAGAYLYSIRDITERRTQEARFRHYVEHSSDVITALSQDGTIEYVSPSVRAVFGHEPAALLGREAFDLIHPEDVGRVRSAFEEVADSVPGTTVWAQYRTRTADGEWAWTESRLTVPDEAIDRAYILNSHDVTELREREGRLSVLDRVLRHNLRNKLNLIVGRARTVDPGDADAVRESVEEIVEASEELLGLSEKARRFDASIRQPDEPVETVEAVAAVRRAIETARSEHPTATIGFEGPETAWVAAHDAFELAIEELLGNALGLGEGPAPTVSVSVQVTDDETVLEIADEGPGIPEENRRTLLEGEETPLEHGEGLGLWLVRWTIDNSGESLDVRENEPHGTVVELRLPRRSPPDS